ncbi:MAG: site-specific integrase [Candidatus Dadabacteria bacterium]|nr:site-specific integrase [Candidatus Dadabacteria bacterium]
MTISVDKRVFYNEIASSALAQNTRIAYDKGWRCFEDYCISRNIDPFSITPEQTADFIIDLATQPRSNSGKILSMGTVSLYRSGINKKYTDAEKTSPMNHPKVVAVFKGLARIKGTAPRRVNALRERDIKRMLDQCPDTPIGKRDAAILAVGFAGALRRSEICALTMNDVEFIEPQSVKDSWKMFIYIRKSKTDQEGRGHKIAIPEGKYVKPIKRLRDWLQASGITEGPLFQTMKRGGRLRGLPMHHSDIPRLVKHYAALIGLDPKQVSGHSLRAGFVTSAAVHHARLDKIMEVTRHSNPSTVMRYIRDVDYFVDHAGEKFL